MALVPGTRFGPYEIVALIGSGGMGEVYRARDIRLDRDVAIKILPDAFASDPERVARFQREAKTLASLNHPNIGGIYGLEDSGGVIALVMELVEGEDLSQRISRGPIPFDEALPIAKQIAEALEAAHEQGINHRDLKPANIKVRADGTVKVLDFGLAKATNPPISPPNVSQSPTITTPAMTQAGMILGTAAYMAPEQAKGRDADKRSDVWAFGCVLYQMLTGRRAFDGDDMTEVLGAVVRLEPHWEALSPDVPPAIRTLLQRCLVKERRTRIADIAAARFVLDHQAGAAGTSVAPAGPLPSRPLWRRVATLTAGALVVAAAVATLMWVATRPTPAAVVRTAITTSGLTAFTPLATDRNVAITPDGARIVYRGNNQLLVRALNHLEPMVLSGVGVPRGVFISPDGQWIGFFDGPNRLKKVAITGGSAVSIGRVDGGGPRGATWGPDGTIIFATNLSATGLQRISAAGGESTVLTTPDRELGEGDHVWPEWLPGGDAVLFTITPAGSDIENAQIAVLDLRTGASKVLLRGGSHAHYLPTGHLVYGVAGTLRAIAFDPRRLEVLGSPAPVLEGLATTRTGAAEVAVAANGSLVYVSGAGVDGGQTVVSVDRQGRASPLQGLPLDSYRDVRVSPDGARLALATQTQVWTYDILRAARSPLTTGPSVDRSPLWTPDSQRIIFTSSRAGYPELFWRRADGTGSDERLLTRSKNLLNLRADGWSADGTQFLFVEVESDAKSAIGQSPIARPSEARVLVKSEFRDNRAAVSPRGGWLAYESNMSGREEIYIERYPALGSRQPISMGGGRLPLWSPNGGELFFSSLDGRQMFAVAVQSGSTLVAGRPQVLFEVAMAPIEGGSRPYDLSPDGRFVIIRTTDAEGTSGTRSNLIVVQNWTEELNRLVPTQ